MPASFIEVFHDLMPYSGVAQPGYLDGHGRWVASGVSVPFICRVELRRRVLQDIGGREVVSNASVFMGSYIGIDPSTWRVLLTDVPFLPSGYLAPITVEPAMDFDGPIAEVFYLP